MNVFKAISKRESLKEKYEEVTVRMFGYVTVYSKHLGKFFHKREPKKEFDKDYGHLDIYGLNKERVRLCGEMNELATLAVIKEEQRRYESKKDWC